jgi:hypothetical protein
MQTIKWEIGKHRSWIGKHFYHIFILAGLLFTIVLGLEPYLILVNAPSYSFKPGFSGFGIARNETVILPTMMVVGLGSDPPELWFQYFFECEANGTYNFIFAFPFNITGQIGSSRNMSFRATTRGSAVWSRYEVNTVSYGWQSAEVWGVFSIENTFQSGTRGSYTFILPFGMGISAEVIGDLQHELGIGFHTPDVNISLQVGLPSRFKIIGTFPPVSAGPNVWVTPTNRSITTMEWHFEKLQDSVTINCEDQNEIAFYETLPFISGLFLGIGIPIITTTLYDAVKEWSRPFPKHEDFE